MKDPRDALRHPRQPIGLDARGVARFKENPIIRWMLERGERGERFDLNKIVLLAGDGGAFSWADVAQVWQQMGYSVSGFGGLDFMPKEEIEACDREVAILIEESERKP